MEEVKVSLGKHMRAISIASEVMTRRAAIALSTCVLFSSPAVARVDGIPFYAPGDKVVLPGAGFETWLPRIEALQLSALPSLRAAIQSKNWAAAAQFLSADSLSYQLKVFGSTASILGDEACAHIWRCSQS